MDRDVQPEILDELSPTDPSAVHSRADLRRLNAIMGNAGILARALDPRSIVPLSGRRPLRLVELGAGDGTVLLSVARRWARLGIQAKLTLLDRHDLTSAETIEAFAALGWTIEHRAMDVFAWLEQPSIPVDLVFANLFLHHFRTEPLTRLMRLAGERTSYLLVCEPRRSNLALAASKLLWLLGCNGVTRHDAAVSVRGGFSDQDLSSLWAWSDGWELTEGPQGLFSHVFIAKRGLPRTMDSPSSPVAARP
ncbi:MAG: hypothetical protein JNN07_09070 [Verrucomicrobiales bacterium]|nr:hypothetical protein [Verrucomicrobiales bacterium]